MEETPFHDTPYLLLPLNPFPNSFSPFSKVLVFLLSRKTNRFVRISLALAGLFPGF